MDASAVLALTAVAYLLGAIPFAYVFGRLAGVDIRKEGTGNVGAGNLTRVAGVRFGALAALCDGLKGLVAVLLARRVSTDVSLASAGLAAVAGHNWSVFLRGRAGRGLATSAGVLLGVAPGLLVWPTIWAAAGWAVGGLGGFLGWGLLPFVAVVAATGSTTVTLTAGLAFLMIVRRAQGNRERSPGLRAALVRIVTDRDPLDGEGDEVAAAT